MWQGLGTKCCTGAGPECTQNPCEWKGQASQTEACESLSCWWHNETWAKEPSGAAGVSVYMFGRWQWADSRQPLHLKGRDGARSSQGTSHRAG